MHMPFWYLRLTSDLADANVVCGTVEQDFGGVLNDVPVLINQYSKPDDIIGKTVAIPTAFALQRAAAVATGSAVAARARAKEQAVPKSKSVVGLYSSSRRPLFKATDT